VTATATGQTTRTTIVIAGGAMVGLSLALALKQSFGEDMSIVVADPALAQRPSRDGRATAIIAAGRHLFEALGIWDAIAAGAQPINEMIVTDSRVDDAVRPTFLTFSGNVGSNEGSAEPFAHMVENRHVVDALVAKAEREGVSLRAEAVASVDADTSGATVTFAAGDALSAILVVAADGARSKLRDRAGIATHGWDHHQSAVVVTVAHARDHGGRAEEHFLPAGPFAILPLTGKRSSLVWTETPSDAARLLALPDDEFLTELERRFGLHLGDLSVTDKPRALPLSYFVARSFVGRRLALIGDAAHVIHPIAGQGLNLGLKDAASLAEVVVDAARLGMDIGADDVLDNYQRWRRFDTVAMGIATNGLNLLFSNDLGPLRAVRDIGLGLVDRMPPLKSALISQAAGLSGEVPRLLRGESL
jgi:2-octaprenyl-6-methoxyphenol hydroxylase